MIVDLLCERELAVTRPIDIINPVHLSVRYAGSLAPLVGTLSDWQIVLYFYRVDKQ